MKGYSIKITMALAAILPLTACENEIETIWSDDNPPVLVLNAQIKQDEAEHTLFVYCSEKSHCEAVDAKVTVQVNSKDVELVHEQDQESARYVFSTPLVAGDKLYFKAEYNGLTATARAEVPVAVGEITKVEVSEVTVESMLDGEKEQRRQDAVTFKDNVGTQDFYMLVVTDVYSRIDADGQSVREYHHKVHVDTSLDKVLNPMGAEVSEFLGYGNDFNVFSDEMFADGSYTLKILASKWGYYYGEWNDFWAEFQEGDSYKKDRHYKIYTLDFDEFLYVKAISAAYNDIGFMTEPMIYPENVTGGLGFVSAITPIEWITPGTPVPFTGEIPM